MGGKGSGKAILLCQDSILEFQHIVKAMFLEQNAGRIHLLPVFIPVTPSANRIEILQSKTKRIDLGMATSTVCSFTMCCKPFTQG